MDGDYVHANKAASSLLNKSGFRAEGSAREFIESLRVVNGGNPFPWRTDSGSASATELFEFASKFNGEKIFELQATELSVNENPSSGWLVELLEITPFAAALKGQADAARHRDKLVSLLSHDMRTPLVSIITTLAHPDFKSVPENLRQIVEQASRRGLRMVDSVVRLVRAESTAYKFAPIELRHIVEEAIDLVWQASSDANIRVELRPSELEFVVSIDRGLMIQVLTSLLNTMIANAVAGSTVVCMLTEANLAGDSSVSCVLSATLGVGREREIDSMGSVASTSSEPVIRRAEDAENLAFATAVISRHHGVLRYDAEGEMEEIILGLPLVER